MAMATLKRRASQSPEDTEDTTESKRARTSDANVDTPKPETFRLLDLPAELILKVFNLAQEPCMIHTCKALYEVLPAFVEYTQKLLLLAYGSNDLPIQGPGDDPFWILPGHKGRQWTRAERNAMQLSAATSHWLRPEHLSSTHMTLCHRLWRVTVLEDPRIEIAPRHKQWLQSADLASELRSSKWPKCINAKLTTRTGNAIALEIHITDLIVRIAALLDSDGSATSALAPVDYIPDCLMIYEKLNTLHPNFSWSSQTSYLRELFLRQASYDQHLYDKYAADDIITEHMEPQLSCNGVLLEREIRRVLEEPIPYAERPKQYTDDDQILKKWLKLNIACGGPVKITYAMAESCLKYNLPRCLDELLSHHLELPFTLEQFANSSRPVPLFQGKTSAFSMADVKRLEDAAVKIGYEHGSEIFEPLEDATSRWDKQYRRLLYDHRERTEFPKFDRATQARQDHDEELSEPDESCPCTPCKINGEEPDEAVGESLHSEREEELDGEQDFGGEEGIAYDSDDYETGDEDGEEDQGSDPLHDDEPLPWEDWSEAQWRDFMDEEAEPESEDEEFSDDDRDSAASDPWLHRMRWGGGEDASTDGEDDEDVQNDEDNEHVDEAERKEGNKDNEDAVGSRAPPQRPWSFPGPGVPVPPPGIFIPR
jgi:hypothetical protein